MSFSAMGLLAYLGFVGFAALLAAAVKRFDPSTVAQLSRKTELSGATGWAAYLLAILWACLPILFGASFDDELWAVGAAGSVAGAFLLVIALASVDEYRLLRRAETVRPEGVSTGTGDDLVATAGVPSVDDGTEATTPASGHPAVHTDWLVQRREQVGTRTAWSGVAGGVTSADFTFVDGAVAVAPGSGRAFTNAERYPTFEADESLPDRVASFLRRHPDLPDPAERDETVRFVESFVPADEAVTVVGTPRQSARPGQRVIDSAPPDRSLATRLGLTGDGDDADPVLIRGDVDEATTRLHRRVRWLGAGGVALLILGQLLSFWLSTATLPLP
jgi:hypothetical protein